MKDNEVSKLHRKSNEIEKIVNAFVHKLCLKNILIIFPETGHKASTFLVVTSAVAE